MMLEGKVAIITGASRGMGAATAKLFAENGAKVVVNYLNNVEAAEKVVASIRESGGDAVSIQADVRSSEQMDSLVKQTLSLFGKVDILINNAAIQFTLKSFSDMQWDEFKNKIEEEVKAAFVSTKAVASIMKKQKYGKLVYISSGLSHHATPGFISHGTAKGAINSFVKYLAQELGPYNITANTLSPGMVETDATKDFSKEQKDQIASYTPLGRIANPEDVARAILFYASDQSAFITGTYVPISGGLEMN